MDEDSKRNWKRMLFRVAPIAFRTPISRVRSVTETNMMFITPTAPTKSEMDVTIRPTRMTTPMVLLKAPTSVSSLLMEKSSVCDGRRFRIFRISPIVSNSRSFTISWFGAFTAMFTSCRPCEPPKELS